MNTTEIEELTQFVLDSKPKGRIPKPHPSGNPALEEDTAFDSNDLFDAIKIVTDGGEDVRSFPTQADIIIAAKIDLTSKAVAQ
jgi:hypothetical protein